MSFIGRTIGKITGASDQAKAAQQGAQTQAASAQAGIDETRRQFDAYQNMLAQFTDAGRGSLVGQQDLLGLNGMPAQQTAIGGIQSSPMFSAMAAQGEDAILQNASATGGLRGGNVQGALAQFRPQLLAQLIEQQYGRLGGLTQMGQASAAGVGAAGMQTGANIGNLLQQQGAATAGGQLAMGSIGRQGFGDLMAIAGTATGMKKAGMF